VWTRIHNLVEADKAAHAMQAARTQAAAAQAPARASWWHSLLVWRGAAAAGVLATVAAVAVGVQVTGALKARSGEQIAALQQQLNATPQIQYVAVLADAKADASMLVTFDPKHQQLVLQRVGAFQEGADKSLQLWALPPGQGPRSLGVLGHDNLLRLTAQEGDVKEVPALAISLEPLGGVPSATGPTGPVLFKGALIRKAT
jgi:anti-sigma-K factor RskA